jgi:hypothetical protein
MKHTTTSTLYVQILNILRHYAFALGTVILFLGLFIFSVMHLLRESRILASQIIATDVANLASVFKKIDDQCKIVDFDHQKSYIDFLNVGSFAGSQIGPMDLMFPNKWQGPYLKDNPSVQGKVYQVVRTRRGYFIAPADGIKLANGKIIGKDIVLNEKADIAAMAQSSEFLMYEGKPLAVRVPMSGVSVDKQKALALINDEM